MTQWLLNTANHYGYAVVFFGVIIETFGVPFPGETAILVGAVLAGDHRLNAIGVGITAWAAAVLGPSASYVLFRAYGRRILAIPTVQRLYKPEHLERAEKFFARRGWWGVFGSRFVAVLRIFTGPLAGLHRMPPVAFMVANAVGAAVWVTVIVIVGLAVGAHLDQAISDVSKAGLIGLVIVGCGLLAAGAVWLVKRRRRSVQ